MEVQSSGTKLNPGLSHCREKWERSSSYEKPETVNLGVYVTGYVSAERKEFWLCLDQVFHN